MPEPTSGRKFRFGAIILAAGASTRMGQPKQLLSFHGQPLLVRAVEAALASEAWPVIAVLGANASAIRPSLARLPVMIAENSAWAEGMAASIRSGITMLQQFSRSIDGALIAPCDQPGFQAGAIRKIVAAQQSTGSTIVASRFEGRNAAPALFLREHFATLQALTGEDGARHLLNGDPTQLTVVDLPELALDLDTPADYARLLEKTEPSRPTVQPEPGALRSIEELATKPAADAERSQTP